MKLGIIGHFGGGLDFVDGQTVKTKNLEGLLCAHGAGPLFKVDTYYNKTNKFRLLLDSLRCVLTCDTIFLLVSVGGMKFYFPFLYVMNRLLHRRVYHYIVGSELLELVDRFPRFVRYLNSFEKNWFEYNSGTDRLRRAGVRNAETLSNFKALTPVPAPTAWTPGAEGFRVCTFSRVMEEKGITDAVEAVRALNNTHSGPPVTLDIYGPVDPPYAPVLRRLLEENPGCVSYRGVIDSGRSVEVLRSYFALLFPTRWPGEGFPGTILDAFASGVPVIASDWNANKEILCNWKQGIIYPDPKAATLEEALRWAVCHPAQMDEMRRASRSAYEQYTPGHVWAVIQKEIGRTESP